MRSRLFVLPVAGMLVLAACAPRRALAPLRLAPSVADSVSTTALAPGSQLHRIVNVRAPWRAYVLEVDLGCTTLRAMKGGSRAVGRTTTSGLLASLPASSGAVATINADFFLFAPPGVPTNLHVEDGALLAGPGGKPVVTVRDGRVAIDSITVRGTLRRGTDTLAITAWNRPVASRTGVVDARWDVPLDTLVRRAVWRLEPLSGSGQAPAGPAGISGRYVARSGRRADTLATGDTLLLHFPARASLGRVRDGDTVQLEVGLAGRDRPVRITQAVGGRPIVLADSAITADVDTEGNEGFRNLNPRSAIGVDRAGRRAWLVVIDGRQPGYSMGMTLRQVGNLLQALGATVALNLDGGGSSALAIRDRMTAQDRVVNRPSDPVERPVGNGLAVFSTCRSR